MMLRHLSGFLHSLRNVCARNNVAHLALSSHYLSLLDLRLKSFTNTSIGLALSRILVLPALKYCPCIRLDKLKEISENDLVCHDS